MALFSRFASSFTPSFLKNNFDQLTIGRSIGYYFFWWFFGVFILTIIGAIFGWHYSAPEKVLPLLDRVPPFEFQFEDNKLVKTNFPTDPYVHNQQPNMLVFVSTKLTEVPVEYKGKQGFYLLQDHMEIRQTERQGMDRQSYMSYSDLKIGTDTFNNEKLKQGVTQGYPHFRAMAVPFLFVIALFFAAMISLFYFLLSFFWALVVFLISKIGDLPRLTYEQSWIFVLHLFFPVVIVCALFSVILSHFPFLMSLLFVLAYLLNALKTQKSQ